MKLGTGPAQEEIYRPDRVKSPPGLSTCQVPTRPPSWGHRFHITFQQPSTLRSLLFIKDFNIDDLDDPLSPSILLVEFLRHLRPGCQIVQNRITNPLRSTLSQHSRNETPRPPSLLFLEVVHTSVPRSLCTPRYVLLSFAFTPTTDPVDRFRTSK